MLLDGEKFTFRVEMRFRRCDVAASNDAKGRVLYSLKTDDV